MPIIPQNEDEKRSGMPVVVHQNSQGNCVTLFAICSGRVYKEGRLQRTWDQLSGDASGMKKGKAEKDLSQREMTHFFTFWDTVQDIEVRRVELKNKNPRNLSPSIKMRHLNGLRRIIHFTIIHLRRNRRFFCFGGFRGSRIIMHLLDPSKFFLKGLRHRVKRTV